MKGVAFIDYPKPLMSIRELTDMGFPRNTLQEWARVKDAPVIYSAGGGKVFFKTAQLDEFAKVMAIRTRRGKFVY
ncbi:hypothetical protein [Parasporobacterium paucivorans]|nr:hypothetical protein [Parasporobacterium paucivorans]